MRPRDVLAANLKNLMAATPSLSTFPQITKAGGGSNGTLDRIRRKTTATSVDNLEALAKVYGVLPWHLLVPGLPVGEGTAKPGWPFALVTAARFDALEPRDKGFVEARLLQAVEECEKRRAKSAKVMNVIHGPAVPDATVERHLPALPPGEAEAAFKRALSKPAKSRKPVTRKSA